jgi:hypothetical protein
MATVDSDKVVCGGIHAMTVAVLVVLALIVVLVLNVELALIVVLASFVISSLQLYFLPQLICCSQFLFPFLYKLPIMLERKIYFFAVIQPALLTTDFKRFYLST